MAHSLFFDDVTPDAIQAHASGLPRGFMVKNDELSTWFKSFARYNNKSSQGARGFWNKAFDGASLSVARKADDLRGGVRAQTEIPRYRSDFWAVPIRARSRISSRGTGS